MIVSSLHASSRGHYFPTNPTAVLDVPGGPSVELRRQSERQTIQPLFQLRLLRLAYTYKFGHQRTVHFRHRSGRAQKLILRCAQGWRKCEDRPQRAKVQISPVDSALAEFLQVDEQRTCSQGSCKNRAASCVSCVLHNSSS